MSTPDLAGRTAFITGGAQGIGLGIARAAAAAGMHVALADVDAAALEQAKAELAATTQVATVVLDVREREAFAAAADQVEAEVGPVWLVCNNAGVAGNVKVPNLTYEAWDWVMGINLDGVYNGIQTFVPRLIERGGGHVVNTASGAGLLSAYSGFLYAASKAAVVGLSEALRTELAPYSVGVTCLCPSAVNTNIIGNTTGSAPDVGERTVMDGMDEHLGFFAKLLADGTDPDLVGRMVLDGVRDGSTYVLTDDLMRNHLQLRTDELLAAMPTPAA